MNITKLKKQFVNNFGVNSLVSAFIGVVTGACLLLLTPGKTISLWIFGTYVIVSIFIIWCLVLGLLNRNISSEVLNIKVIKFCTSKNNELKCLLDACDYLTYGAYITLFEFSNGIEEYVATGVVENIQGNGIVTVKIITKMSDEECERVLANNVDLINALSAKPIVTEYAFEYIGGIENV